MQIITYTNSQGASHTFTYGSNTNILHDFTDTQSVNNWTTTGYNQHGVTYLKSLMNERTIDLSFWVIGENMEDFYLKRKEMISLFNPVLGLGTLEYYNGVVDRVLDVYVDSMPKQDEDYGNGRRFTVTLKAAYPFYRDKELNGVTFANAYGGIAFSLCFDTTETFGWDRRSAMVTNAGDVETPVTVVIKGAEMTNPRIVLADGRYIGLNKTVAATDEITIKTEYGNKSITINGKSADKYLMTGSTWIQLPVGTTRVACAVEEGTPNVQLYWYNHYLGV